MLLCVFSALCSTPVWLRLACPGENRVHLLLLHTHCMHPASRINDTGMAGAFTTVLTDISGSILTSTATIDSVSLGDNGRNISCFDINGATYKLVQVEGNVYNNTATSITLNISIQPHTLTVL